MKMEEMMADENKKEPSDKRALMERKFSQERMNKLLQISKGLTDTARTAEGDLQEKYQKISEKLDRLIIEEAKFQEQTMQDVQQQP